MVVVISFQLHLGVVAAKLKVDKTQFVKLGLSHQLSAVRGAQLIVGGSQVVAAINVTNLGVTVNVQRPIKAHVGKVVRAQRFLSTS